MMPIAIARAGRLAACAGMLMMLLLSTACERVAPVRTLPKYVRGVYIPMIANQSFEPALEEDATRLTQEEFLLDGRVQVVPRDQADLMVVAEITDWRERASGTSGDDVVENTEYLLTANVRLFEPFDDEKPLAELPAIRIRENFNTDERSSRYAPEPDRREIILRELAERIVESTIEGFPTQVRNQPAGVTLPEVPLPGQVGRNDVLRAPRANEQ
jgi:hypothetical protein